MAYKKTLIANWKLNHTRASAEEFFRKVFSSLGQDDSDIRLAIAPVAPMLDFVGQKIAGSAIELAAQNVFYEKKGAFTGEWSADQLREAGVKACIIGHSERRQYFFETDADVQKKLHACLKAGITPVVCVGESLAQREDGETYTTLTNQIQTVFGDLRTFLNKEAFVAYEPIWAIGTGKSATENEIENAHMHIKAVLNDTLGESSLDQVKTIYGGSVSAENINKIVSLPDVDGVLVGGASLQAESFLTMVNMLRDL